MNIEEQVKQFLDEICNKYKHISCSKTPEDIHKMNNEMQDFFYKNYKQLNTLSHKQYKSIETYGIKISNKFIDKEVSHIFWYSGIIYNFETLLMDK